jgi:hypothetical protein
VSTSNYVPVPGKIPGVAFNLGGNDFILAPLNLQQVEAMEPVIAKFKDANDMAAVAEVARQLVTASLSRNYPDITEDDVKHLLDLGQMREAIQAVLGVSGYKTAGEGKPGGQ